MEGMNITVKCGFESKSSIYCLLTLRKILQFRFLYLKVEMKPALLFSLL